MSPNPWSLTDLEEEAVSLLCESGDQIIVANALGVTPGSVRNRMIAVRQKMGEPNSLRACIEYERWAAKAVAA